MALPLTGITFSSVNNYTGAGKSDLGQLCTYSYLKPYSKYGPVNYPENPRTNRHNYSRWKIYKDIYNVNHFVPNPPTGGSQSPYVLGDFRGYNHEAIPFYVTIDKFNVAGIGDGFTSYVATNETSANFTLNIFLPEVVDNSLPAVSGFKDTLTISLDYRLNEGGASYKTIKTQSFSYATNSGTTLVVQCSQNSGLPYAGQTTYPVYYVAVNGAYFSGATYSVTGKIYKQFVDNFDNPLTSPLYRTISFSDYVSLDTSSGLSAGDVKFNVFRQYVGDQSYPNGVIYIENLIVVPSIGVYLEYSSNGSTWTRYNTKINSGSYSSYDKTPPNYITGAGYANATYWRFTAGVLT